MRFATATLVLLLAIGCVDSLKLKVGCRVGYPPWNDIQGGACVGLMYEAFNLIANLQNITYDRIVLTHSATIDEFLVLAANGTSPLDVVINFHTITPARLKTYTYSSAIANSGISAAVGPKYKRGTADIASAVISNSVLYLFAIMSLIFMGCALVFLIFEHMHEDSEMLELPYWRRPLWALEQGVEVVFTGSTSGALSSQFSRSLRGFAACMALFLVAIFGADITAQLTVASVTVVPTTTNDLKGAVIAISSSTLKNYLTKVVGATTVSVSDINAFAAEWYAGQHPDVDGYATATDIVNYLHNYYGMASEGYGVSEEFYPAGTFDLRAYGISFAAPNGTVDAFNAGLSTIRDNGQLAQLIQNFIVSADPGVNGDLPVPSAVYSALKVVIGVMFGLLLLMSAVLFVYGKVKENRTGKDEFEDDILEFEGQRYTGFSTAHARVLEAISDFIADHDNGPEGLKTKHD